MDVLARCCRPFTVGVHLRSSGRDRDHQRQDGHISALLILTILLGLGVSLSVAQWITTLSEQSRLGTATNITLAFFMLLACAVMIIFCTCAFGMSKRDGIASASGNMEQLFVKHLSLTGLAVFFVFALFPDIFAVIVVLQCWATFAKCQLAFYSLSSAVYMLVRIIFKFTLLVFTYHFDGRIFRQSKIVNYGLVFILLATLCNWCVATTSDLLQTTYMHYTLIDVCPSYIYHNFTDIHFLCSTSNTSLYHLYDMSARYLYPMDIEFSLLAAKITTHMLSSAGSVVPTTSDPRRTSAIDETTTLLPDGRELQLTTSDGSEQSEHWYSTTGQLHHSSSHEQWLCHGNIHCNIPVSCLVYAAVLSNPLFLALGIYSLVTGTTNHYLQFRLAVWVLLLMTSTGAFYLINKHFKSDYGSYTGMELVTLASTLGTSVHLWIQLFPSLACKFYPINCIPGKVDSPNLVISYALLNLIQVYMQTALMLYASRVRAGSAEGDARRVWWLRQCLLYMAVTNVTLWLSDSVIETNGIHDSQSQYYEGHFAVLLHITIPFFLFYRFNSFLILMNTYLKHKRRLD